MAIKKRSVTIAGHATSVTLEDAFWDSLHIIAQQKNMTIPALIGSIDEQRTVKGDGHNLSSAIRLYVLDFYKNKQLKIM
jgi:predicted DNA-binding ribbon-helix-helix protein